MTNNQNTVYVVSIDWYEYSWSHGGWVAGIYPSKTAATAAARRIIKECKKADRLYGGPCEYSFYIDEMPIGRSSDSGPCWSHLE